jgi:glucosamine-phosphate N-acetyltransferase
MNKDEIIEGLRRTLSYYAVMNGAASGLLARDALARYQASPADAGPATLVREMVCDDLWRGFQDAIKPLGAPRQMLSSLIGLFRARSAAGVRTYVAVAGDEVVGTASLIVEQKYLHSGGRAGHIEDVSVASTHQEKGVGRALVEHLLQVCKQEGVYKVVLACSEDNVAFYERLGFRRHEVAMRVDLEG